MLLGLYSVTLFISATLLFVVQPMFARMILPLLGGSPAVWNTTQVFYQAALLAGYGYAHLARRLAPRRQIGLHVLLLLLPLLVLPIRVPTDSLPPIASNPAPWLLLLLTVAVGLPFFVVAASSPLLQRWFAGTGHRAAGDPYFLYAASNLGSLLALLAYPVIIERSLRLAEQSHWWTGGYLLLAALIVGCGVMVWRALQSTPAPWESPPVAAPAGEVTFKQRARWVLLAFVPASLMLSVTTYISTDIAAIPLLWVIPLALYLLTFVLVFARKPLLPHALMVELFPIAMLPLVVLLASQVTQTTLRSIPIHLLAFFVVAMVCHGELARERPGPRHLTEFYLWLSVGGVLGGGFNALLAPLLFKNVMEYSLTVALGCLLLPNRAPAEQESPRARRLDWALPLGLFFLVAGLVVGLPDREWLPYRLVLGVTFGLPALICFTFARRPVRFGLGVGAIMLAGVLFNGSAGRVLYAERTFFGIHRVLLDDSGNYHVLTHGSTVHGMQSVDPARRQEALTYYTPSGPIGQVFAIFNGALADREIAVVGLGSGSVACHRQPGQRWTFYEIDPSVERIARDLRYFTYLRDCLPDAEVVLGDARFSLASARSGQYSLILLDAYSSDAMPVHLITREALQLYVDKLAPGGLLAFNISNRYFDLKPVLSNLAEDAGLAYRSRDDLDVTEAERQQGKIGSQWVVLARSPDDLGRLLDDPRWLPPRPRADIPVWTDDFNSMLSALY